MINKITKDIIIKRSKYFMFLKNKKNEENEKKRINCKIEINNKLYYNYDNKFTYYRLLKDLNIYNNNIVYINMENNNGKFLDKNLNDFIEDDIKINIINSNTILGLKCIWHSTAHLLGHLLENDYGIILKNGPATDKGFYYEGKNIDDNIKIPYLNKKLINLINDNIEFETMELTKNEAYQMFNYNPYKINIISNTLDKIYIYKSGDFIDLCQGPHIKNTEIINNSQIVGKENNNDLIRIYGTSNKNNDIIDHRIIGEKQKIFRIEETSPGSPYYLPHGVKIINKLINLLRKEYKMRDFYEVSTPLLNKINLWKISGHYDNYKDNMYFIKDYGLKPMNCPCHCLIYKSELRNINDLPIRYADFGILHRNEVSGTLTGLTRVRKFQQDDGHIFCTKDQIKSELKNELNFIKYIFKIFKFDYKFEISTKPENYIGDDNLWELAELSLKNALEENNLEYKINKGDGAFYGPKIDIIIIDNNLKKHQLSTIQLDFNLPEKFDLKYKNQDKLERPVIIHRAVLGSIERSLGILIEHFNGKWPLFLSPRQIKIISINKEFTIFTEKIRKKLLFHDFEVETDNTNFSYNKKIRNAQLDQFNYIITIGKNELKTEILSIRDRDSNNIFKMNINDFINKLNLELNNHLDIYSDLFN